MKWTDCCSLKPVEVLQWKDDFLSLQPSLLLTSITKLVVFRWTTIQIPFWYLLRLPLDSFYLKLYNCKHQVRHRRKMFFTKQSEYPALITEKILSRFRHLLILDMNMYFNIHIFPQITIRMQLWNGKFSIFYVSLSNEWTCQKLFFLIPWVKQFIAVFQVSYNVTLSLAKYALLASESFYFENLIKFCLIINPLKFLIYENSEISMYTICLYSKNAWFCSVHIRVFLSGVD